MVRPNLEQAQIGGFWGKLETTDDGTVTGWLSVADHCMDVGAVFLALLEQPVLRRRLAAAGGVPDLTPAQIQRLGWIAVLHDIGKFSLGFQRQTGVGHIGPVWTLFARTDHHADWRLPALMTWGQTEETALTLLIASVSHHGEPAQRYQNRDVHSSTTWAPFGSLDPWAALRDLFTHADRWFPLAFGPVTPADCLPDRPAFQHLFAGLVSLADWIGSSTTFFPYACSGDRFPAALGRARSALRAMGLDTLSARNALDGVDPVQAALDTFSPNALQSLMASPATVSDTERCIVLEAPTGHGKTEAALIHFLRLFAAGCVDGLVFALPTRAAAIQIHARIRACLARAFAGAGDAVPAVLLAVPGYLRVDDQDGILLPDWKVLWPDDDRNRMAHRGWAAENPKRYLAGSIVVGTIDQVLMSALLTRHAHLRGAALTRHLLVVDEVHSSDSYMTRLLRSVLDDLEAVGGYSLLMSATLGSDALSTFLKTPLPPPAEAEQRPYPGLTTRAGTVAPELVTPELVTPGVVTPETASSGTSPVSKTITLDCLPAMDDPLRVARCAAEAANAGARVLIIRNTVSQVVAVQQALEEHFPDAPLFRCQGSAAPHHARFAAEDRQCLDAAVDAAFGKGSAAPVVLVASQTVEQSLDIDADFLLTDLCPADVLLQRIGRLHRHHRPDRPEGFRQPRCLVIVPADRDLSPFFTKGRGGIGFNRSGVPMAYFNVLSLEATWRQIEETPQWTVPVMNRQIVERATRSDRLAALAASLTIADGPDWQGHANAVSGKTFADRGAASRSLLPRDKNFLHLPETAPDQHIATRLGLNDRVAEFSAPQPGAFARQIRRLTIPGWMAQSTQTGQADAEYAPDIVDRSPLRFRWADLDLIYDRWGLRRESSFSSPSLSALSTPPESSP